MLTTSNKISPIERFWRSVKKTDTCWLWTASKDTAGYGQFGIKGKAILVHRFSYELHKGKIPKGKGYFGTCVLHSCDNPSCVNPEHLRLGTHLENMRDRDMRKRRKTKITREQAEQIRQIYIPRKITEHKIAKLFNISRGNVADILHRRIWK